MTSASDFTKMVPGFDFLQGLMKGGASGLPSMSQWIAPTLDPAELEKRIEELRTVQFWLEQNARMLGVTIQALEVQRMTLSTLKTMNLPLAELRKGFELRMPEAAPTAPSASVSTPTAAPAPAAAAEPAAPQSKPRVRKTAAAPAPGPVDPVQWWGALTKQFTELATNAIKDGSADAAKTLAGAMVKQSIDSAGQALKTVATAPVKAAARAAAPRRPKGG